ncbi:MAG: transporter substrate-binding domain-containing protein, partial [Hyphomicrobium sp.]|nr:transporter substrate-binding domain-containing protein [Hyphomicrobium sp.]
MSCPLPKDHRSGRIFTSVQLSAAIGITAFAIVSAGPLRSEQAAAPAAGDASTLRICATAKELPYSASDKSGFENKIAETLAAAMGRKVEFVWSDKAAIYAVRDQLDKKLCDVVIGVDTGDERVLTSRAYYRAPYVFVQRKDSPLKIVDWDSPDLAKAHPIGFVQGSPAEVMITKLDLYNDNINYVSSLTNFTCW